MQLIWTDGSLNDMEWMALVYAGHTSWGVTNELTHDGYVGGVKRKPRGDWMVQRGTHPALISDVEAEAILTQLERRRSVRVRETGRPFLLTGLLFTPDGRNWTAEWDSKMDSGLYRLSGRGRRVSCRRIDSAVVEQLRAELSSDAAVQHTLKAMREIVAEPIDGRQISATEKRIQSLTSKVATLVDLVADGGQDERAAYRRAIGQAEGERSALIAELDDLRRKASQQASAKAFTVNDAQRLMRMLLDSLESAGADDVHAKKAALGGLIEKVVLDESVEHLCIHYRIGAQGSDTGIKMATPRDCEATPVRWVGERRSIANRRSRA